MSTPLPRGVVESVHLVVCFRERVLSSAANIVNKKRVGVNPQNVDLLVFMRGKKELVN